MICLIIVFKWKLEKEKIEEILSRIPQEGNLSGPWLSLVSLIVRSWTLTHRYSLGDQWSRSGFFGEIDLNLLALNLMCDFFVA